MSWLDRRAFLVRTGLGMATAALARADAAPLLAQVLADDWVSVRGLFNLRTDLLHFGGLLLASHPRPCARCHRSAPDWARQ